MSGSSEDGKLVEDLDLHWCLDNFISVGFVGLPNTQAVVDEDGISCFQNGVNVGVCFWTTFRIPVSKFSSARIHHNAL